MEGQKKNLHNEIKNNEEVLRSDLLSKLTQERQKLEELQNKLPIDFEGNLLFPGGV